MSANLAVINFAVGGTLGITGKTTLADTIKSSSSGEFVGLNTTTLAVSSSSTFNASLPTSTQTPTSNSQLTTKVYVDTADGVLNTRITSVDSSRKTYVDDADGVLNTRITTVDGVRKTYVDDAFTSFLTTPHTFTGLLQMTKPIIQNILNNIVSIGPSNNYPTYLSSSTNTNGSSTYGFNTAIGSNQLTYLNGNGTNTTAIGSNNLTSVVSGIGNTSIGSYVLQSTLSSFSSGVGYNIFPQTNASYCTGIGANVFTTNLSGSSCTGIGRNSGLYMLGSNNTCVGAQTGQASGNNNIYSNSTAIGYGSVITSSNQVVLGTVSETVVCPNTLSVANSITIGANTLSSTLWGYLSGITSSVQTQINNIQTQLNSSTSYTGRVIQMRIYSDKNATYQIDRSPSISGTIIPSFGDYQIFSVNIQPKSSSSQVYINFDTNYGLSGAGYDEWNSKIFLNANNGSSPLTLSYKNVKWGNDNRNSQISLFPISAGYSNTALNVLSIWITVGAQDSNDGLTINGNWNMTITEVQN